MTRSWKAMIAAMLAWLALPGLASAAPPATSRPNVLLILADDLNCDLGCYGHPVVQTPEIDRLAAGGVRFERAYVQYPVCNPSRVSLLCGWRPESTGVLDNHTPFRSKLPHVKTLPQWFREHGYFTAGIGKVFHRGLSPDELAPERDDPASWSHTYYGSATARGREGAGRNMTGGKLAWCHWLAADGGDDDQHDGQLATEACRLLDSAGEEPFFLAVGFYRPHDPFCSPRSYFERYPLAKLRVPGVPTNRSPLVAAALPGGAMLEAFERFSDDDRREFLRAYYAGVSFVDAQVGRLMAALERRQLAERTIVIFLGDNGFHLGEQGWWNKNTLFERSCRVPLVVRVPGARGNGQSSRALVELVDLFPTLVDLCGLPTPHAQAGVSLRPLLENPAGKVKEVARTMVRRGEFVGRSVRTDRWRYTEWNEGAAGAELYDHAADPDEWHNLAVSAEQAGVRRELSALLRAAEMDAEAPADR